MSLVMEDFKPSVSTLEEVKKLQDLVRKLELQNLHLRNKHISSKRRSASPVKEHRTVSNSSRSSKKGTDEKICSDADSYNENSHCSMRDEYFDDLDIIQVSDLEMSDDESWLYSSPNSSRNDRKESPYQWLRKDVDDPENKQLQLTKKALLSKLNELEILSPSTKMSSTPHSGNNVKNFQRSIGKYRNPNSVQNYDTGPIDTRTFTRSKKKQALDFLEKLELINNERSVEKKHSVETLNRRGSDVSTDSLSTCHVLEDANDVQEVARMQEESLRMSSPMGVPKRSSLSSTCRRISSSRGSVSDQDVSEISVFSAYSADDAEQDLFENDSYHIDPSYDSNNSSPSESPYSSNISLYNSDKGYVKLSRCSLPNLARNPGARQSRSKVNRENKVLLSAPVKGQSIQRKSFSSLETSLKKQREKFLSPSRQRQSPNQVPHRGHSSLVSSPNSEPNTNVPRNAESNALRQQPKSALPRPSRASSATRSNARSGIPMPSMQNKKRVDDTWSEGCF